MPEALLESTTTRGSSALRIPSKTAPSASSLQGKERHRGAVGIKAGKGR